MQQKKLNMRIIFVTNNYTPYSGGVVSSIDATVQELRAQNHEVLIVTLDFLGNAHTDPDYVVRITCPIRFIYKNNHMAIPWRPTQELLSITTHFSPDIIHVHHPFLLGLSGLDVARVVDVPCIFTYHTLYEYFAHYVPAPLICSQPFIRKIVKNFCASVDGIIVPSNAVKQHVREQGAIAPVEVIPSALRTMFFSDIVHNADIHNTNVQKIEKNFFELLLVSRFTKEKNIPFVFDIFKQLPDNVRLTLVGYGQEYECMQKLAFNILHLPREQVHFIHKPTQQQLLAAYRAADLFIFPSQTDTQGLVMAEAMSQGLPVVAIDGPGQRDIIKYGNNGYIVADAVQAAEIICLIMSDNSLHQYLRNNAQKTAALYNPYVQVQQLILFYERSRSC
jgi:1,2-diacylglycerol 3-alpha-glucosyltransferase